MFLVVCIFYAGNGFALLLYMHFMKEIGLVCSCMCIL